MSSKTTIRFDDATKQRLNWLKRERYGSLTKIYTIAIKDLYEKEIEMNAKYNLRSSQADRVNFDDMLDFYASFDAAPDAWQNFDESLAEDVVEQDLFALEEQGIIDDAEEARARMMDVIRKQWQDWKEDK
jgi:hypothetical protein